MPQTNTRHSSEPHHESLLDRTIDRAKQQPEPPPRPHAPAADDQGEWHKSVERHQVVPGVTVHDVGLSVYGETRSLHDRPGSNESIHVARERIAHAMINDAELSHVTGKPRNKVHDPVKPSDKVLDNPKERAAYDSSMHAAREAYLNGHDPTNGATYFFLAKTPSRANQVYSSKNKVGVAISTQSALMTTLSPKETRSRALFG